MSGRRPAGPRRTFSRGAGSSSHPLRAAPTICRHFKRNVNLVAPCCNVLVCCEIGHEKSSCPSPLNLKSVVKVVCCSCTYSQEVRAKCRGCSNSFAQVCCLKCNKFYGKDQGFHCDECKRCIQSPQQKTRHCKVCNKCYPISQFAQHTCGGRMCVVCKKDTAGSRDPSTTSRCGHTFHKTCFIRRVEKDFSCPVRTCRKPLSSRSS